MITKEQRLARKGFLGSSDIPAIFGYSQFKTDYDVFCSKVYDNIESKTSPSAKMGNNLEASIVAWTAKEAGLGKMVTDSEKLYYVCQEHPIFAANLDGTPEDTTLRCGIEAKYTTQYWEYGDRGTRELPKRVFCQIQQQLLCSERDYIVVGVFIDKDRIMAAYADDMGFTKQSIKAMINRADKRFYIVERSIPMISHIINTCEGWWKAHVIPALESDKPEKYAPEIKELPRPETHRNIIPVEGKVVKISDDAWFSWTIAQEKIDAGKKEKDEAWAEMMKEKGNAEIAIFPDNSIFQYKTESGGVKINKQMKNKAPKEYQRLINKGYIKEITKRMPRITKPKDGEMQDSEKLPF